MADACWAEKAIVGTGEKDESRTRRRVRKALTSNFRAASRETLSKSNHFGFSSFSTLFLNTASKNLTMSRDTNDNGACRNPVDDLT
jgi:hypothetical protein